MFNLENRDRISCRTRFRRRASRSIFLLLAFVVVVGAFAPSSSSTSPPGWIVGGSRTRHSTATNTALDAKGKKKKKKGAGKDSICVNRQAYRNYEVIDTLEAGISLLGTEVKSIRDGKMNLRDGFVKPSRNGRSCSLHNVHIGRHSMIGEYFQHEERRVRPLLLHRQESRRLLQQTEQKGMTIVPLKAYFNEDNKVKIQIALCRGKNIRDKRATIKEREASREANRIMKNFRV